MRIVRPIAALLILLALLPGCSMFGGSAVTNDTPQRQLVRQATDVNTACEAAYLTTHTLYASGKLKPATLVKLKPVFTAIESARKDLNAHALAGDVTKFDAALSAITAGLGAIAAEQIGAAPATPPTPEEIPIPPGE
jgi:hypothetical protein